MRSLNSSVVSVYLLLIYINYVKGIPVVSSVNYNISTGIITCTSTNGPATHVTWSGTDSSSYEQSQRIVSMENATYLNYLIITSSDITKYTGSFVCTVSNAKGSNSSMIGPYLGKKKVIFIIN